MQARGSLAEIDLRALLENAQTERATGTLTVRDGGGHSATFYFLFGHLFHALADGRTGDDAVVGALGWPSGEFDFDPKAKLPADETVRSSIPDLIENAGSAPAGPALAAPSEPVPAPPPAPPVTFTPEPSSPAISAAGGQPASQSSEPSPAPPAAAAPAPEPPSAVDAPQPRRGVKHRPQPKSGAEPVPVPTGQLIYDSLKTSFVDFPRLITTLEREGYTGYVKLLTEDASGLIFFRDGTALECVFNTGREPMRLGTPALKAFHDEVTHGHGVLDVVGLNPELVAGLYDLTVATPIYSDLYASWVDVSSLLDFLADRSLSGSLMVRSGAGTGVVILSNGRMAGAYTTDAKDVMESADAVLALCQDPNAVIEVKANEGKPRDRLDVDSVIGTNRTLEGTPVPLPTRPAAGGAVAAGPGATPQPSNPASGPAVAPTMPPTAAAANPASPPPAPAATATGWEAQSGPATATPPAPTGAEATQNLPPAPATPVPANPTPAAPATQTLPVQPPAPPSEPVSPPAPVTAMPRVPPNWDTVIADLQATTEEALGNRSRKVKDVLASAERSQAGIESAINQIPTISILFVDSSRLEALASDLRAKLHSYLT